MGWYWMILNGLFLRPTKAVLEKKPPGLTKTEQREM